MLLFSVAAIAEEELLYNPDFSERAISASVPAGWTLTTYQPGEDAGTCLVAEDETFGHYLSLDAPVSNDIRVTQEVKVKPGTVYRLSAKIRTWDVAGKLGATLGADNYEIDGTYCYSEPVFGTEDWQDNEVFILTGPEQTVLNVALRLGGYSMVASGTADFTALSLAEASPDEAGVIIDLANETGLSGYLLPDSSDPVTEKQADESVFFGMLAVGILFIAISASVYFRVLRYENKALSENTDPRLSGTLVLIFAFAIRVILSLVFYGHSTDINCFMAWGNAMATHGPGEFYTSGMFADYPPGYMYILGLITVIARAFGLTYGSPLYALLFKMPATIADLVMAVLVRKLARKAKLGEGLSLALMALVALNPAAAFISGAWGQIDSVLALGLVLTVLFFTSGKKIAAGAVYGLTILLKPQALMLGPILAVAYIADIFGADPKRALRDTLLAVLAAFAAILIPSIPFWAGQEWDWLLKKYVSTTSSYAYATIEAFNFPALLGANWHPVTEKVLGLSYQVWGTISMCIAVAGSSVLYLKTRKKHPGALWVCSALMLTVIFTFGHYMHERYLFPVLFLLLCAYLTERDRRLLIPYLWLSCSLLINVLAAMFIVDHQTLRGPVYNALIAVTSSMEVAGCIHLIYISVSDLLGNKKLPSVLEKPKAEASKKSATGILPLEKTDTRLSWTKTDTRLLLALTIVYSCIALFRLGTLNAPESCWRSDMLGDTVTVHFDTPVDIREVRIFANLADASLNDSGTLRITDGEKELLYTQTYDNMFRWQCLDTDLSGDTIRIELYSGKVKLCEMSFIGDNGAVVTPSSVESGTGGEALFDEQNTVPKDASAFNGMYFDELYHGRTAYEHLENLKPYENSHPPLGKIIIMLGIAVFGMNPFGWRIAGTIVGILMLPVLYVFGKRILKDSRYAFLLAGLFAVDFMHFTQTRIATIDVYAVFFILLMFYYMYRYITMNFFTDGLKATFKPLALSGVFFGIGLACKWICAYAGAGLAVLFFASLGKRYAEYRRVLKEGSPRERKLVAPFWSNVVKTLLFCIVFFIIIPFLIYFASYTPYFIYESGVTENYGLGDMFRSFFNYQNFMYSYHSGLEATHPYQSAWWQWPFTMRPMWYYFGTQADGKIMTLTASGNPAVWWVCTVATIAVFALRANGKLKKSEALWMMGVGILANLLPWVLVSRCTFIYHFFATVPFILMTSVYGLKALEDRFGDVVAPVKWIWLGFALLLFVLLYPGLSGYPVTRAWAALIKCLPGGMLMYGV